LNISWGSLALDGFSCAGVGGDVSSGGGVDDCDHAALAVPAYGAVDPGWGGRGDVYGESVVLVVVG
jgi:hypothetical protein